MSARPRPWLMPLLALATILFFGVGGALLITEVQERSLQDVLVRAGLAGEPDVRASSVAAWAGRRVLEETGRIDLAARALGVRSLDRAARIIGWEWSESASE